jgi:hypothetical protein
MSEDACAGVSQYKMAGCGGLSGMAGPEQSVGGAHERLSRVGGAG